MADELVFMMGQYEARVPTDRRYSENHLWLREQNGSLHVGLTAYSVRLLQDVYFLDWTIDAGVAVSNRQEIGEIESSKAVSSLYAPADGRVINFNLELLNDPTPINTDGYNQGWLYEFETDTKLMTPEEYVQHLDAGWEKAQRHLKGQIN